MRIFSKTAFAAVAGIAIAVAALTVVFKYDTKSTTKNEVQMGEVLRPDLLRSDMFMERFRPAYAFGQGGIPVKVERVPNVLPPGMELPVAKFWTREELSVVFAAFNPPPGQMPKVMLACRPPLRDGATLVPAPYAAYVSDMSMHCFPRG